MARTVRDTNLETRTARLRLAPRRKPYWRVLESGLHLGYRRTKAGGGTWVARRFLGEGQYKEEGLGVADDLQDADGAAVLDFKDAQTKAREVWKRAERVNQGLAPDDGPYTVAQALDDYFAAREADGSKGVQADRYAANARIIPVLGAVEVSRLTSKEIIDWRNAIAASPKLVRTRKFAEQRATKAVDKQDPEAVRARKASANRILTVLKAALNRAYQEGSAQSDDAWRKVKPFREADAAIVQYLTAPEAARLVNACEGAFRNLVRGALLTGCRYGELGRLRCADFNAQSGTLTIRLSKSGKVRHVALSAEGQRLFAELTAGRGQRDLIFRRENGEVWTPSQQQRPLDAACTRAALDPPATFHILRHTYASALAMKGVPMGVIAAQLGHKDTRMTEKHYAHLAPNYVAETVRAAMPDFGFVDAPKVIAIRA